MPSPLCPAVVPGYQAWARPEAVHGDEGHLFSTRRASERLVAGPLSNVCREAPGYAPILLAGQARLRELPLRATGILRQQHEGSPAPREAIGRCIFGGSEAAWSSCSSVSSR